MSQSAALMPSSLVPVLLTLPDYRLYIDGDRIGSLESPYRVALGQALKKVGDQLLSVSEQGAATLSGAEAKTLDTLVERIGEILQGLGIHGDLQVSVRGKRIHNRLARHDQRILDLMGSLQKRSSGLHRQPVSLWMHAEVVPFYRELIRLRREVRLRNELLWIGDEVTRREVREDAP